MAKGFYITTPIFYPNAKLHMGHAYTTTVADIIARYHRQLGEPVYFLSGSDENTQKMVDAARSAGKEPLQFLEEIVAQFHGLYGTLNISCDQFIRTTDQKRHWPGAQELWRRLTAAGDLYEKEYEGLYCTGHEAFITEKDLVDGVCPDHNLKPEHLKERNYFFRLSRYGDALREAIVSDRLHIIPASRKHEILAFIDRGLEDVSFSRPRRADWPKGLGVPIPEDPSQVMYVWCDALSNYLTALGYGTDSTLYDLFWPAAVQVLGKDILRFHAAIWPAMLLSAELPLPRTLLVHGFITSGGKKMSKTLGNVIDPQELLSEYGTDAVRYFLSRHIALFEDGDMTREAFKDAYNAHLANGLGNLVSRIMTLSEAHLPEPVPFEEQIPTVFREAFAVLDINRAMEIIFTEIASLNQAITEQEPFRVVKEDSEKGKALIRDVVIRLQGIAVMLMPFMPATAEIMQKALRENKKPPTLFPRKE